MSVRVKVYGFLVLAAVLITGNYFLKQHLSVQDSSNSSPEVEKNRQEDITPVELVTARQDEISSYITSTANLRALRLVDVASQADGIVRSVGVEEGDFVPKGQLLCQLDDTELQIRLQLARQRSAQADLQLEKGHVLQEKAFVQIQSSRRELQRLQRALEEKLVSEQEYAESKDRLDELEHDGRVATSEMKELTHRVKELKAEVEQARLEIQRTRIKAPFSGRITERTVEVGETVRKLDSLFKLGAFSPLQADVYLSEKEAHRARTGQMALIRLGVEQSAEIQGRVARVSPVVDQSSGTVKVTVELNPTPGGFKPGAFVQVAIQTDTRANAVLIPKRAVIQEEGESFVFVAKGETAARTKIRVGYEADGVAEISEGLLVGQKVVVAGQGALEDGSKIKIIQR